MIIDGKKIAEEMIVDMKQEIAKLKRPPKLAAVLVGDIGGSRKFLELKKSVAEKIGIDFKIYEFPENITTRQLRKKVSEIAKVKTNDAVIVELPLPKHINAQYILNAIPESKDADVLSQKSQGSFFARLDSAKRAGKNKILPPAVEAVKVIFEKNNIVVNGKNCAVFGYGLLVGKPVSHWLGQVGATMTIINEFTKSPEIFSKNADIVISGVGKPGLITADMVKEGAMVIDFGYGSLDGKIVGDVDFAGVSPKAALITPVPGGVGPIVVVAVLKSLLTLHKND